MLADRAPGAAARGNYLPCRLYGDWLVGFSDMLSSLAFDGTAPGVRPSFSPATRVGVFSFASWRSCLTSAGVHGLPLAGRCASSERIFSAFRAAVASCPSNLARRRSRWIDAPPAFDCEPDRVTRNNYWRHCMSEDPKSSPSTPAEQFPMRLSVRPKLRRVVIEEELDHPNRQRRLREANQKRVLDWARQASGYGADLDPHAYSPATFRMINERKLLDEIQEADTVVPLLDNWNYWTKVDDWPSRNQVLEELTTKARKRTASRRDPVLAGDLQADDLQSGAQLPGGAWLLGRPVIGGEPAGGPPHRAHRP
jgi:hypothetical protein